MSDPQPTEVEISDMANPETFAEPFVGARVYFWYAKASGELFPVPAMLMRIGKLDGLWDMKLFKADVHAPFMRTAVPYSETPKKGHWSWMPNGVM